MRDDLARDLESLGFFRHPVPRRRIPLFTREQDTPRWQSRSVALTLLILIVGGSFLMADRPPSITFLAWPRGEKPLDHLPFLNAMSMVVGPGSGWLSRFLRPWVRTAGYAGSSLVPRRRTTREPIHPKSELGFPQGRNTIFLITVFNPVSPGSWLFVHFIAQTAAHGPGAGRNRDRHPEPSARPVSAV